MASTNNSTNIHLQLTNTRRVYHFPVPFYRCQTTILYSWRHHQYRPGRRPANVRVRALCAEWKLLPIAVWFVLYLETWDIHYRAKDWGHPHKNILICPAHIPVITRSIEFQLSMTHLEGHEWILLRMYLDQKWILLFFIEVVRSCSKTQKIWLFSQHCIGQNYISTRHLGHNFIFYMKSIN